MQSHVTQSNLKAESRQAFYFRGGKFDLSERTHVVGILNVTPDSFSDGGKFFDHGAALRHAERMIKEGADAIDVGGESTRPSSTPVDESEEMARVLPVISELAKHFDTAVLVDTYKASVAAAALDSGAQIVNNVGALGLDPAVAHVVARYRAGLVLMHMRGTPQTMQDDPEYQDVVSEVRSSLDKSIKKACTSGVSLESIILDPGIGFGKKLEHNLKILKNLSEFKQLGRPIMVGPSRKSFIGQLLNLPVNQRLHGTLAAIAVSILCGASIIRVHDVKQGREATIIADAIAGS